MKNLRRRGKKWRQKERRERWWREEEVERKLRLPFLRK